MRVYDKVVALRAAIREGDDAYARGEFVDVPLDRLEDFVVKLGQEASERVRARSNG